MHIYHIYIAMMLQTLPLRWVPSNTWYKHLDYSSTYKKRDLDIEKKKKKSPRVISMTVPIAPKKFCCSVRSMSQREIHIASASYVTVYKYIMRIIYDHQNTVAAHIARNIHITIHHFSIAHNIHKYRRVYKCDSRQESSVLRTR